MLNFNPSSLRFKFIYLTKIFMMVLPFIHFLKMPCMNQD